MFTGYMGKTDLLMWSKIFSSPCAYGGTAHVVQQQQLIHNINIMSSFRWRLRRWPLYISSAATSASSMCVFRLHGLDQDFREKIFESVHDPRSNPSRTFQETPHINLFSIVFTIPFYFLSISVDFYILHSFSSLFISQFRTQRFDVIFVVCLMMRLPDGGPT
jgi:hypothetical protein